MLETLIFDVDGTLSETEEVHRRAFNETFAAFGLAWRWDRALYRELLKVTGGKERLTHYIRRFDADAAPAAEIEALVGRLHRHKTERYVALIDDGAAALRPGVARLLDEARSEGVRLAIATTTSEPNVLALLRAALGGAGPRLFDAIAAGDIVKNKKPAPDIYRVALERLGRPAAACLAVEDSLNGLQSAAGAGCPVLIVPSVYTDDQDFAGALAVVPDLDRAGDAVPSADGRVHVAALRRLMAKP